MRTETIFLIFALALPGNLAAGPVIAPRGAATVTTPMLAPLRFALLSDSRVFSGLRKEAMLTGGILPVPTRMEIIQQAVRRMSDASRADKPESVTIPFLEEIQGASPEEKLFHLYYGNDSRRERSRARRLLRLDAAIEETARKTTARAREFLIEFDAESEAPMRPEEEAEARALIARFEYIGDAAVAAKLSEAVLTRKSRAAKMDLSIKFDPNGNVWERRRILLDTMTGERQAAIGRFVAALTGPGSGASAKQRGIVSLAEARERYGRKKPSGVPFPDDTGRVLKFPATETRGDFKEAHTRDIDFALAWLSRFAMREDRPVVDEESLNSLLDIVKRNASVELAASGWFPEDEFAAVVDASLRALEKSRRESDGKHAALILIVRRLTAAAETVSSEGGSALVAAKLGDWNERMRLVEAETNAPRTRFSVGGAKRAAARIFGTGLAGVSLLSLIGYAFIRRYAMLRRALGSLREEDGSNPRQPR